MDATTKFGNIRALSGEAAALAGQLGPEFSIPVTAAGDLAQAVAASDIVITCTTARRFFIARGMVKPGAFIAAVGADNEDKQEIDPLLLAHATVVPDLLEQACAIGDLHHAIVAGLMTPADVRAQISEIIAGPSPGAPATTKSSYSIRPAPRCRTSQPRPLFTGGRSGSSQASIFPSTRNLHGETHMRYQLTPIFCRPWLLNGLSVKLIESHYENNYGGALRRLNAITEKLESVDFDKTPGYVINGLKREELIALNSTLLHELYFASLGGEGKPTAPLAEALARDFGSVDRWRSEFVAMGNALAGGSGWVLLVYVPRDRRLINQCAAEHTQTLAGSIPILALDMFEHAYHIDFGANAKAYVDAFMRNVDWKAVEGRYEDAAKVEPPRPLVQPEFGDLPGVGVEEVRAMLDAGKPVQFIDARPRHFVSRTQDIIDGATWRDPDRVREWAGELSKSDPVVVFCVYGFHVGCKTAIALREAGFDAKYMKGGHSGWRATGGPVKTYA